MSTYLSAFLVGKFDKVEVLTKRGISVRGYTPVGLSHGALEHTKIAAESIDLYEEYFQIEYPLPKLDLVALHRSLNRAMENWGLITFMTRVLINDPRTTPSELFQRNARTVAHEVSHMWFGNLVTMEWWDHLWLNEGFARYAEHYILDKLRPQFNIWSKYLKQVIDTAFQADMYLDLTHPVHVPVPEADLIESIFDTISYAKGSVICRMINSFIGDQAVFQQCLKVYMNKYAYGTTTTADLLRVMDEVSGKRVTEVFTPWIEQPCFPEVFVQRISQNQYQLTQSCFGRPSSPLIWPIPIHFQYAISGKTGFYLIDQKESIVTLDDLTISDSVCFNSDYSGFYICTYIKEELSEDELEAQFSELNQLLLNNRSLSVFGRYGILSDLKYSRQMHEAILIHFKNDRDIGIWYILHPYIVTKYREQMVLSSDFDSLKTFVANTLEKPICDVLKSLPNIGILQALEQHDL